MADLSLTSLPNELVAAIAHRIDDQNALFNLSRCSRLCYEITRPVLYSHVKLFRYTDSSRTVILPQAYDFACQILGDHRLAALVQSISFVPRSTDKKLHRSGIPAGDLDRNVRRVISEHYGWDGEETWLIAFKESRNSEAAVAILLPFLPNLSELDLYFSHEAPVYCSRVLEWAHQNSPWFPETAFRRLKHVSITNSQCGVRCLQLSSLFAMPNLLKITASPLWNAPSETALRDLKVNYLRRGSSSVTDLSLSNLRLRPREILHFIEPCRALKALELIWVDDSFQFLPSGEAGAEWQALDDALLSAPSCLQSLTLGYTSTSMPSWARRGNDPRQGSLPSLPHLMELKFLRIGSSFIFDHLDYLAVKPFDVNPQNSKLVVETLARVLPMNVETLSVTCHGVKDLNLLLLNIEVVMTVAKGSFSRLRSIAVEHVRQNLLQTFQLLKSADAQYLAIETRVMASELKKRGQDLGIAFQWFVY